MSKILLYLGLVVVVCMGGQFYLTKRNETQLRTALDERLPRTINDQQETLIVQLLKPSQIPKGRVLINPSLDGEAWAFGEKIKDVLNESGFTAEVLPFGKRALAFNKPGQFLWIKDTEHRPADLGPVYEAFGRAGIVFQAEEHKEDDAVPDTETVIIAISTHP